MKKVRITSKQVTTFDTTVNMSNEDWARYREAVDDADISFKEETAVIEEISTRYPCTANASDYGVLEDIEFELEAQLPDSGDPASATM